MLRLPEILNFEHADLSLRIFKVGRITLANFIYIIFDKSSNDAILIDPGWEHELILDQLNDLGANLVAILLTHSDEDHTNGVENVLAVVNAPVYISSFEKCPENLVSSSPQSLKHMDELQLGSLHALCIHTPGHSPGSFCFQIGDFLFTGDTLFIEGCGYCAPPFGSTSDMFHSLQNLRGMMNDEILVFPAHQYLAPPGLKMKQVRRINPYLRIRDLDTFTIFSQRRVIDIPKMNE